MNLDPRLRLRHINCFMEIARKGSIVSAADQLHVTQPAVSKTLRELEEILGQRLFDRSRRRLKLNAAGVAFQKFAGAGLADLARAQAAVRSAKPRQTKLAVGVLPTAATDLLPRAAIAFRETNPECVLRVSTGPNWLLLSQLREGSLDIVVGRMAEPERMAGLSFRQLYTEDIIAVVRPNHPLKELIHPDPLFEYPLVLPPAGAIINHTVQSYLVSIGAGAVSPAFETVALAFGRRVVQSSNAIWFISQGVIGEELALRRLRALHLGAAMTVGPVGISLRAEAPTSPELLALTKTLQDAAVELKGAP